MILKKITKIGATRCQILKLKCIKIDFIWGSALDPAEGAYSAPSDLLAVFKGAYLGGRGTEEGKRMGRERKGGRGSERRGGRTTLHTPCRKFLATPLSLRIVSRKQHVSPLLYPVVNLFLAYFYMQTYIPAYITEENLDVNTYYRYALRRRP